MNIRICFLKELIAGLSSEAIGDVCPFCRWNNCPRHGSYRRKGFHSPVRGTTFDIAVPRFRCCNPECPHSTFSVLPPLVLRYCRFFWPCLISVAICLGQGRGARELAQRWLVGKDVIVRAHGLLERLRTWVGGLFRELSDGAAIRGLKTMVTFLTAEIGRDELNHRWYQHRYPRRFFLTRKENTQFTDSKLTL
jgi:hypothetical protein